MKGNENTFQEQAFSIIEEIKNSQNLSQGDDFNQKDNELSKGDEELKVMGDSQNDKTHVIDNPKPLDDSSSDDDLL